MSRPANTSAPTIKRRRTNTDTRKFAQDQQVAFNAYSANKRKGTRHKLRRTDGTIDGLPRIPDSHRAIPNKGVVQRTSTMGRRARTTN